jgi:hypothetical protein
MAYLLGSLINYDGLRQAVREECSTCILNEIERADKCSNCTFRRGSKTQGDGSRGDKPKFKSRTPVTPVLREYGFPQGDNLYLYGKHQVHLYLYYPQLGGCGNIPMPSLEDIQAANSQTLDLLLDINYSKYENWLFVTHHINGRYWDDRRINLAFCINNEHPSFHRITNMNERNILLNALAARNQILFGTPACPTFDID